MIHLLEALSIPLAAAAAAIALERAMNASRRTDRMFFGMATFASVLLVLAQSSWFAQVMNGMDIDTEVNNATWAVFNLLVAASYSYAAWTHRYR